MILMIDNYDSFTYNLVQYFAELGQDVVVRRNDDISLEEITQLAPQFLVISPGPCSPDQAGISMAAIREFAGKVPILGVCLGHQAIAQVLGAKVIRARQVMHGKNSLIRHKAQSVFTQLPDPFDVTRYHSLVVDRASLGNCLLETAWTVGADGQRDEIMGLMHPSLPIHGVQFHPEAILSQHGMALLQNFLRLSGSGQA